MKNKILASAVTAAAVLAASPLAHANGELQIWVSGVLEFDSGSQSSGLISEDYSSGGVTADVNAAWAGTLLPSIDLSQIDINGAGNVKIVFSSNGNTPTGGPSTVDLAVSGHDYSGGTLNGTVSAYWSANNALLATTTLLASENTLTGDVTATGTFDPTAPYTLTEVVNITTGSGNLSTDDSISVVPDGGMTVAMLGGVMTAFAMVRSKIGKK
jgi:hypothetical protein